MLLHREILGSPDEEAKGERMKGRRYIPKYLNAQMQLLWWEMDEILVMMVFVGLGIVSDHQYIGTAIGWAAMKGYTVVKYVKQPGYAKHVAYKYGFWGIRERVPEYWVKELV